VPGGRHGERECFARGGRLLQAKGFRYELGRLLGGDVPDALLKGSFATIYLAPWHYHRIHAPAADGWSKCVTCRASCSA
jgi:phosphatidylserine decarboxylase